MAKKEFRAIFGDKVAADKRKEFIEAFKAADSKEARTEVLKQFGIKLTAEEKEEFIKSMDGTVKDEEIDVAGGGGCGCYSCMNIPISCLNCF